MDDDEDDEDDSDRELEKKRDKRELLKKLKNELSTKLEETNKDRKKALETFSKSTGKHCKTRKILTKQMLQQGLAQRQRRFSFPTLEDRVRLEIIEDIDKALNIDPLEQLNSATDINNTYGRIKANISPHSLVNLNFDDMSYENYRDSKVMESFSSSQTIQDCSHDNSEGTDNIYITEDGTMLGKTLDNMGNYTEEFSLEQLNKLRIHEQAQQQMINLDRLNRGENLEETTTQSVECLTVENLTSTHKKNKSDADEDTEVDESKLDKANTQGSQDEGHSDKDLTTTEKNKRQDSNNEDDSDTEFSTARRNEGLNSFECSNNERLRKMAKYREEQEKIDLDYKYLQEKLALDNNAEDIREATHVHNKHGTKILAKIYKERVLPTAKTIITKEVRKIERQQREEGQKCNLKIPNDFQELENLKKKVARISIQRYSAEVEGLKSKLQKYLEELEKFEAKVVANYRNSKEVTRKINKIIELVENDTDDSVGVKEFVARCTDAQKFYNKTRCNCGTARENIQDEIMTISEPLSNKSTAKSSESGNQLNLSLSMNQSQRLANQPIIGNLLICRDHCTLCRNKPQIVNLTLQTLITKNNQELLNEDFQTLLVQLPKTWKLADNKEWKAPAEIKLGE